MHTVDKKPEIPAQENYSLYNEKNYNAYASLEHCLFIQLFCFRAFLLSVRTGKKRKQKETT